jgi:5-oxoprolinase (ATP-hydrolysing)
MKKHIATWEFWIDVGGTFTDCLAYDPNGKLHTCKTLSSGVIKGCAGIGSNDTEIVNSMLSEYPEDFFRGYTLRVGSCESKVCSSKPASIELESPLPIQEGSAYEIYSGEEAPVLAIRRLMGLGLDAPVGDIRLFLGTTRGTNALLERKGSKAALVITQGFADLLEIGSQARPELFNLSIKKPSKLYSSVLEVEERVNAKGEVLKALNHEKLRRDLEALKASGIDSIAICLLNSYVNPCHEIEVKRIAEGCAFSHLSVSTELTPTLQVLPRCGTAMINAYLSPIIEDYVQSLRQSMPKAEIRMMTSAGGLVSDRHFVGKDSLLSGPAGGVVGFIHAAKAEGYDQLIGFDMGGTSTDVSRYAGEYEYRFNFEQGGYPLVAPMLAIETVAAGGGSICSFDGQRLCVGPESAGANPGPACYGRGGPLTITDVNLFCGKIVEEFFPFPLDNTAVKKRLTEIQEQLDSPMSLAALAEGFSCIAKQKMASAIKSISSAKGYNPADHTLVAFGGAGAQHACQIADALNMETILLAPFGGILSAYGIGMADIHRFSEKSVLAPFTPENLEKLFPQIREIEEKAIEAILAEGIPLRSAPETVYHFDLRYLGEDSVITVKGKDYSSIKKEFENLHLQFYAFIHKDRAIELTTLRIEVIATRPKIEIPLLKKRETGKLKAVRTIVCQFEGKDIETPIYQRGEVFPGDKIQGPALLVEGFSTIVIDPSWQATLSSHGSLILKRVKALAQTEKINLESDPVNMELFHNHFAYIATQMGQALQKASLSVNVKERLDFSCAVLDAEGELVANAPHIPVHLGAMGDSVKGLLTAGIPICDGDVFLSNDPALGGSHLPDLTVMTPIFIDGKIRFFTASRAHHSEIGGITPGSFYPFAKNLAEEGVVLSNVLIAEKGRFLEDEIHKLLTEAEYPSRSPHENIADIRAAIAANNIGKRELFTMIDRFTWPVVTAYMGHIRCASEKKVRTALSQFSNGKYNFCDSMDNGAKISVSVTLQDGSIEMDFAGSAPINGNSLNANKAIVRSAAMYCMRCLIDEDIPLNAGMLKPVELKVPNGMLNPPSHKDPSCRAAVVGGNVEISQRVVDVILGALGKASASQGTMNNVIFGNKNFGYYETIGGGCGAGPSFDGASASHSHMTNTRITDVEILEHRYPIRIQRFSVRRGSGGKGLHDGGDGIIRSFEFLEDLELSLLTQRRSSQPFGLEGGSPGAAGRNILIRAGSATGEDLPSLSQISVKTGDLLEINTPGGGGFGKDT